MKNGDLVPSFQNKKRERASKSTSNKEGMITGKVMNRAPRGRRLVEIQALEIGLRHLPKSSEVPHSQGD